MLVKKEFKEELVRSDQSVTFKKRINNNPVEIIAITDSILLFSQENENPDSISFHSYLFAFNDSMDLNADTKRDLVIYCAPNMHGQCFPLVFLSDKNGKLHYRSDIGLFNMKYDTASKYILSYYFGSPYTASKKEIYKWNNDSLELLRGASNQLLSPRGDFETIFYKGKNMTVYKKVVSSSEKIYDTAIFHDIYNIPFFKELQ